MSLSVDGLSRFLRICKGERKKERERGGEMRGSCDWLFVYVGSGVSLGVAKLWACGVQCVGWQFYANNSIERALHMSRRPLVSSEILGHRLQDPLLPFWQRFTSGGVMLCLNTSNMGKLQVFFIWGFCQFVGFSQISSSWKQRGLELVGLGGDFFFFFSFYHLFVWIICQLSRDDDILPS